VARRRRIGLALGALAAVALALAAAGPERLRRASWIARGLPAWLLRAAAPAEPPLFSQLAASQVGYGPDLRKEFSSPRPFGAFRVVREADGREALRGGPGREIATDLLGPGRSAWIGDFTALRAPGRYHLEADNGLRSAPFDVGPEVFDAAVRAVQRAFYYQRAFTAVEAPFAQGPWVHGSDADRAPPGERQGWHDAGDYSLYNASAASALFWLLEAERDFGPTADDTGIPESGNGVPDLLDEARWELEWILSVQEPSGGFRNTTCLEHYQPYGANPPERGPRYRAGEVGTLATGRAVGILADAAEAFRRWDPAFAARCLAAARRGQAYMESRPGESSDGPTCPAFRQDGDARAGREVRMLAAAGLLLATGEPRFREAFEASFVELENDPSYLRPNVYAALLYLRAPAADPARAIALRARLARHAALARADGRAHPFGAALRYFWGSLGAGFQRAAAFGARACLADPAGAAADCDQALAAVHYALGRNALGICHVSGLPGVTRGRTHAFHHWLASLSATPYLFPGLVAGGPNAAPADADRSYPHARPVPLWGYRGDPAFPRDDRTPPEGRYTDNDSFSTNELDVDWQAVALYDLYLARALSRGQAPPAGRAPSGPGRYAEPEPRP
jgi:endoglucanase